MEAKIKGIKITECSEVDREKQTMWSTGLHMWPYALCTWLFNRNYFSLVLFTCVKCWSVLCKSEPPLHLHPWLFGSHPTTNTHPCPQIPIKTKLLQSNWPYKPTSISYSSQYKLTWFYKASKFNDYRAQVRKNIQFKNAKQSVTLSLLIALLSSAEVGEPRRPCQVYFRWR